MRFADMPKWHRLRKISEIEGFVENVIVFPSFSKGFGSGG